MYENTSRNSRDSLIAFVCECWGKEDRVGLLNVLKSIYYSARKDRGDYTHTTTIAYKYWQRMGIFGWKFNNREKKRSEEYKIICLNDIRDTKRLLDELGIKYTTKEYKSTQDMVVRESRLLYYNTDITYSIPKDRIVPIWEILSEGKLLCRKKRTNGWAERMECSDVAHEIAESIYKIYDTNFPKTQKFCTTDITIYTSKSHLQIMRLFGNSGSYYSNNVFNYWEFGYKDLTEEQRAGLEWTILTSLMKKFEKKGSEYTTYESNDEDITISPHYPKELWESKLKDW